MPTHLYSRITKKNAGGMPPTVQTVIQCQHGEIEGHCSVYVSKAISMANAASRKPRKAMWAMQASA